MESGGKKVRKTNFGVSSDKTFELRRSEAMDGRKV
jgi:hypothetical protein